VLALHYGNVGWSVDCRQTVCHHEHRLNTTVDTPTELAKVNKIVPACGDSFAIELSARGSTLRKVGSLCSGAKGDERS